MTVAINRAGGCVHAAGSRGPKKFTGCRVESFRSDSGGADQLKSAFVVNYAWGAISFFVVSVVGPEIKGPFGLPKSPASLLVEANNKLFVIAVKMDDEGVIVRNWGSRRGAPMIALEVPSLPEFFAALCVQCCSPVSTKVKENGAVRNHWGRRRIAVHRMTELRIGIFEY